MEGQKIYICVTPFFPSPESWRGAYVYDQVKAIERNSDYKVLVFKPGAEDYEFDGIHVYGFKEIVMPSYIFNGFTNGYNNKQFIKRIHSLGLDINQIAIVHCHSCMNGSYGLALKKINPNIKVLLQHHNIDTLLVVNGKFADWKLNNHYRARRAIDIFNRVDVHVCISEPVRESLLAFPKARPAETYGPYLKRMSQLADLPSVKPKKIIVLNNGVDTKVFNKGESKKTVEGIYRIGCIANFQPLKDHLTLIKAFEKLINKGYNKLILSLLGTGATRQECMDYVNTHGLNNYVEWPTEVYHEDLPKYYRSLDLFVLPSVFEGFGCVYTEAYACGVPFMGVIGQGAEEVIMLNERDKWLIKPHDIDGLANLIERHYLNRDQQTLCKPIDIDDLIKGFLKEIEL